LDGKEAGVYHEGKEAKEAEEVEEKTCPNKEEQLSGDADGAGMKAEGTDFGCGGFFEFGGEDGKEFGGKSVEHGLQDDFGFAEAGAEIEMERIEAAPSGDGVGGNAVGNVGSSFEEFVVQPIHRFGKDAKLVEKAGALGEKDGVEDAVPGGGALSGIAAEEFRFEGIDYGNFRKVPAGGVKCLAAINEQARDASHEFGGDTNLLSRANQLTTGTKRESVLKSYADYGITRFPARDDGIENATFVARQGREPRKRNTSPSGRG
jgi:hypothetical protein